MIHPQDMEAPKTFFRKRAQEMGFALCGFTTPDPPEGYPRYEQWIRAGMHGEMRYLASERAREARADPHRLLPSVRSIVALAMPYQPPQNVDPLPLGGRVAAYAMGEDYHDILPGKLRLLCREIDSLAGRPLEHRVYTDTGPILEREIASRAGLGWIGRNSMLIHPVFGSFFFLAEILTAFTFPPDPPFTADRCGTCDRCLRACPTECLLPSRTLDSRRCISYLTIEHRGAIPREMRGRIGGWVFGCDLCQLACPWNQKPVLEADACFLPRAHFPITDMTRELLLTEEELRGRFRLSALRRTGRRGYRRNLALALGNTGRKGVEPALREAQADDDPVVRESASWALKKIDSGVKNG